jgi:hypothetical protein
MDVTLPAGADFKQVVGASDNAFIFVTEGNLLIGDSRQHLRPVFCWLPASP